MEESITMEYSVGSKGQIVIAKEIRDRLAEIKAIQQLLQGKYRMYSANNWGKIPA